MLARAPPEWPLHLSALHSLIAVINEELPKEETFQVLPKRDIDAFKILSINLGDLLTWDKTL